MIFPIPKLESILVFSNHTAPVEIDLKLISFRKNRNKVNG